MNPRLVLLFLFHLYIYQQLLAEVTVIIAGNKSERQAIEVRLCGCFSSGSKELGGGLL